MSTTSNKSKPANSKADDPAYIYNAATRRYVKRDGITGRRVAVEMKRDELRSHVEHHMISSALENRNLLKTDLSNEELLNILKKLVDAKIYQDPSLVPKSLLKKMAATSLSESPPPSPPRLFRQTGEHKKHPAQSPPPAPRKKPRAKRSKKSKSKKSSKQPTSRRRYVVRSPPVETDFSDTTAFETDAFVGDSASSGDSTSDISD